MTLLRDLRDAIRGNVVIVVLFILNAVFRGAGGQNLGAAARSAPSVRCGSPGG